MMATLITVVVVVVVTSTTTTTTTTATTHIRMWEKTGYFTLSIYYSNLHCVHKSDTLDFCHNFCECRSIFKISLLVDSQ